MVKTNASTYTYIHGDTHTHTHGHTRANTHTHKHTRSRLHIFVCIIFYQQEFSDYCLRLYCFFFFHNVSATVSSCLRRVSPVYLDVEMISQVESFRCQDKQGTPEEGRSIQQPKRCGKKNNHKTKTIVRKLLLIKNNQASSQKFRQLVRINVVINNICEKLIYLPPHFRGTLVK